MNRKRIVLHPALFLLAALTTLTAVRPAELHAGWIQDLIKPPSSQLEYPWREVERPVTLSKGWATIGLGFTYAYASEYYNDEGKLRGGDYALQDSIWRLTLRYGWTRNLTLGFSLPYHIRDFDNDVSFSTHDSGLGDGSLWATYQVFHHDAPRMASVAVRLRAEVPTGEESPGSIGNISIDSLLLGRGTYALALSCVYKQQVGIVAMETEVGYNWRIRDSVQFAVGPHGEAGHIDFGDEIFGRSEVDSQLLPSVSVNGAFEALHRGRTAQGVRGHLDDLPDTDGWELHVETGAQVRLSSHWEAALSARFPVGGDNTNALFPLTYTANSVRMVLTFMF